MLKQLQAAQNKSLSIKKTLSKLIAENNDLMHLAKRACVSYLKCVHIMKDKEVFNLGQIDKDKFAESLGLMNVPQLEFANDTSIQITNTMSRAEQRSSRIKMLREQSKKAKEMKQQQQLKKIWEDVDDGEQIDSGDESEEVVKSKKPNGFG